LLKNLAKRDIRALKIGAFCVAGIFLFVMGSGWLGQWRAVRRSVAVKKMKLAALDMGQLRRAALSEIVPVFEMPRSQEKQKFLFRGKINEQLKKVGLKTEPPQFIAGRKMTDLAGYKLIRLRCRSGKCNLEQILDFLAILKENPYLVGIEEFKMECDPKKRGEFKLDMTISAFAKSAE